MASEKKKIILAVVISLGLVAIIVFSMIASRKCKPHCSGSFCGPNTDDGCGGTCGCNEGGKCIQNSNGLHVCCYPNCNGLHWGDDGCGGHCECSFLPCYDKTANCQKTIQANCDENCVTPCENGKCTKNVCCYPQDCNNVFCGPDGCGGTCGCQTGATCSAQGVCANAGKPGSYNIISSTGVERTNVASALDCAGWAPENVQLNLSAFPCGSYKDCPDGDYLYKRCKTGEDCVCVKNSSGQGYCDRNNVYQWWYYDPNDSSGYNCTKIRQGSDVCGLNTAGAVGFDIIGNDGPTTAGSCGTNCVISPQCPSSGAGSCCPGNLSQLGQTSQCVDSSGITKCCLNNPNATGYADCIKSYPDCTKLPGAWWKGNLGEITNGVCGVKSTGPAIHINNQTLQNPHFASACTNAQPGQECTYNDGTSSFQGLCKTCSDGSLKCFPDETCVRISESSAVPGMCSSKNLCSN
uniref:Uncharacterized protein n=1 Tax=viral metagenome TaxID=1070528 RepID=A0A6C0EM47_9ZZZZ